MNPQELNDFLHRNKMSGKDLAAKLGVHWTTISRWRNGREQIPKMVELALKWVEYDPLIDSIGKNGNGGEHYE